MHIVRSPPDTRFNCTSDTPLNVDDVAEGGALSKSPGGQLMLSNFVRKL